MDSSIALKSFNAEKSLLVWIELSQSALLKRDSAICVSWSNMIRMILKDTV